jgi:hypothetical protein
MNSIETNTHQDHVIAHVLGTTILGSFIWDETLYLLLDIGFVWNIYLDFEMGLLPHPVAIEEMEIAEGIKTELRSDIDVLMSTRPGQLRRFDPSLLQSPIQEVELFVVDELLRMKINGVDEDVWVESNINQRSLQLSG